MVTLGRALDVVMELPPEELELLVSIVQERRIDARRAEIAANVREARTLLAAGRLKLQSAEEVTASLRESLDEPE